MAAIIGWLALSFAVSFLLGSIPWGVIVSKLAYHKDIRDEGSGNIGTTNAFRAMGKAGGALVFVLDFGKGLLSGWLAFWFWAPLAGWAEIDYSLAGATLPATVEGLPVDAGALALALAFAGCTLGHIFSPWLKFKGGKGIAVAAATVRAHVPEVIAERVAAAPASASAAVGAEEKGEAAASDAR